MKVNLYTNTKGNKDKKLTTLKDCIHHGLINYKSVGNVKLSKIKDLTQVKITKVIAVNDDYIIEII